MIRTSGRKLHTLLSAHIAWPLLYGPQRPEKYQVRRQWREKRKVLSEPLELRLERRNRLLGELLAHAGRRVPYWRELFRAQGIDPEGIDNPTAVLEALPVLSRRTLQEERSRLVSDDFVSRHPQPNASGGSTGKPVNFFTDRSFRVQVTAAVWAADSLAGWRHGAPTAYLWGSDRDLAGSRSFSGKLKLFFRNHRLFNTFDITEQGILEAHRAMQARPPDVLVGYASSVHMLARLLVEKGGRPPCYPAHGVITSAETLTLSMRADIEKVFGSGSVFNRYGSREAGLIAYECPAHCGLHLNLDDLVVELLDDNHRPVGPGAPGRVYITTLYNRAMPLIRFDLEDLAEMSEHSCDCGHDSSPLMARVLGRSSDTIRTADGRLVHGEFFTHLFYRMPEVRRFQFVQEEPDSYRLRYESSERLDEDTLGPLREKLAAMLGPEAKVLFERCERIEPLPSGKYRFTVSLTGGL